MVVVQSNDDFSDVLESTSHYSSVVIVGDLNLHLDVKNDPGTMKFESLLAANNYVQHVSVATHVGGHLLDVVLTRGDLPALSTNVSQPGGLSDHSMIVCQLNISAQDHHDTVVQYRRNWRSFELLAEMC